MRGIGLGLGELERAAIEVHIRPSERRAPRPRGSPCKASKRTSATTCHASAFSASTSRSTSPSGPFPRRSGTARACAPGSGAGSWDAVAVRERPRGRPPRRSGRTASTSEDAVALVGPVAEAPVQARHVLALDAVHAPRPDARGRCRAAGHPWRGVAARAGCEPRRARPRTARASAATVGMPRSRGRARAAGRGPSPRPPARCARSSARPPAVTAPGRAPSPCQRWRPSKK